LKRENKQIPTEHGDERNERECGEQKKRLHDRRRRYEFKYSEANRGDQGDRQQVKA
jgi:hypothetical protein